MELEKQVVSLYLAKKLKALGVKQESLFYWGFLKHDFEGVGEWTILNDGHRYEFDEGDTFAAFTCSELGEMLPLKFATSRERNKEKLEYVVVSWGMNLPIQHECKYAETEADARAKMVVYLIENNLLTLKEDRKK